MPSKNVFKPKQQRSQDTQRKLIAALHLCLQDKFFEHISIKELAERAGVSVGTFYRRFKDKESLVPLLYQDFGDDLLQWVGRLELNQYSDLTAAVEQLSVEVYNFLASRKSIFRTLHLNSRLHSSLLDSDELVDRRAIYRRLAAVLLKFGTEIKVAEPSKAADMAIFMMITSLLDKVLYPSLTPAIATNASAEELTLELPKILLPYLKLESI